VLASVTGALLLAGCGTSSVHSTTTNILEPPGARVGTAPPGLASSFVYRVPSGSMEPTVRIGANVNVTRGAAPAVGAIVVFHPPEGAATQECGPKPHVIKPGAAACATPIPHEAMMEFIKRVVAGPGDEIYIREGHVYRKASGSHDFLREQDSYARACGRARECQFPVPIKIPAGSWFLMGDNRRESDDSRFWGPVPRSWIAGVAAHAKAQPVMEREKPKGSKTTAAPTSQHPSGTSSASHSQAHGHHRYAAFIACLRRSGVHVSSAGTTGGGESHNGQERVSARRCLKEVFGTSTR
jgi:signal peptidase I